MKSHIYTTTHVLISKAPYPYSCGSVYVVLCLLSTVGVDTSTTESAGVFFNLWECECDNRSLRHVPIASKGALNEYFLNT